MLVPITHARTLASPREAVALYAALGERTIGLRDFRASDPTKIARLVDAVATEHDHTVTFERGQLAPAREALRELALSRVYGYLDVRTRLANLRIWPALYSWVETRGEPTFETTSIAAALERFEATAGEPMNRGFITMHDAAKPLVTKLILDLGAEASVRFETSPAVAIALTELFEGERLVWGAEMIFVVFPDGEISGSLTTLDPKIHAKWHATIDEAIEKAGLSRP